MGIFDKVREYRAEKAAHAAHYFTVRQNPLLAGAYSVDMYVSWEWVQEAEISSKVWKLHHYYHSVKIQKNATINGKLCEKHTCTFFHLTEEQLADVIQSLTVIGFEQLSC